jgi:hypothetical protein
MELERFALPMSDRASHSLDGSHAVVITVALLSLIFVMQLAGFK